MQHLMNSMQNQDFNTRKMGIDVIFTLAKIHPIALKPYKKEMFDILTELRFDKMKPVREATIEALNAMKEAPELEINEEEMNK
jgi:hypothetical protein